MPLRDHPLDGRLSRIFVFTGDDFRAFEQAHEWCSMRQISCGPDGGYAIGLRRGDEKPAKLREMNGEEIASLDGLMFGNFRDGPVYVSVFEKLDAMDMNLDTEALLSAAAMLSANGASEFAEEVNKAVRALTYTVSPLSSQFQPVIH